MTDRHLGHVNQKVCESRCKLFACKLYKNLTTRFSRSKENRCCHEYGTYVSLTIRKAKFVLLTYLLLFLANERSMVLYIWKVNETQVSETAVFSHLNWRISGGFPGKALDVSTCGSVLYTYPIRALHAAQNESQMSVIGSYCIRSSFFPVLLGRFNIKILAWSHK